MSGTGRVTVSLRQSTGGTALRILEGRTYASRVEDPVRLPGVPAEDLLSVLRVHADRVHDAVRRLGVDAAGAADVVEASALALVDTVAERPQDVEDAAGWWFAEARRLSAGARTGRPDLPLGGGLLSADEDQRVLAECLDGLPEQERLAVLARDAYQLPWPVVAGALQVDRERAAQVVAQARLLAVPLLDDEPAPPVPPHASLAELARLGEGAPVAPRDATAQRHTKACSACAAVAASQGRVSLLLSGLAVVALPAERRTLLLDRSEDEARRRLPAAAALELTDDEWDAYQDEQRLLPPVLAVLGVLLAVLLGVGAGYQLSRAPGTAADAGVLPAVTLPPVQPTAPVPIDLPPPPPVPEPRTTVFVLPPSPSPSSAPPAPAAPAPAPALQVAPGSGQDGATVTVTGAGWEPGARVEVDYLDPAGRPTGSRTSADVRDDGTFTASLVARDPEGEPGRYQVRAASGSTTRSAPYDVTA